MKRSLQLAVERFPERTKLIHELYTHNSSFQSLCDDYMEVVDLLQKPNENGPERLSENLQELETLLIELEQEMFIFFQEARKQEF